MISGNYNNFNSQSWSPSYGAVKDIVPEQIGEKLPESVQNIDAKEIASSNGAISTVEGANKQSLIATLPIYGAFVGLRTLNDTIGSKFSFSGEYEKSVLGKIGKFGDKISEKFLQIVPDSFENKVKSGVKNVKTFVQNHSAFVRSISTPLKLENSTAQSEANGLFGRAMYDNAELFEKGFKGDVKALFRGKGTSSFWNLLKSKGIETADNKDALKIVTETFRDIAQKPVKDVKVQQYVDDIVNALSKSNESAVISKWGKVNVSKIPVLGKLLELNVPMSEISNKLKVSAGAGGATVIGKGMTSSFAKIYEGLTSNFIGGKLAPAMQAYFLASAAVMAKDAPEGQKLATFMNEEAAAVATLFTMPLATKLMTSIGGSLKYVGMGKTVEEQAKNVDKFRGLVKSLNEKVAAGSITRGEYADAVKEIKTVLKGDTKFWQKPAKFLGKIIGANYKAETIMPYIDNNIPSDMGKLKTVGVSVLNKIKTLGYKLKTSGANPAGILRFAIVMFVLSPIITKPIQKVVNKIFGEPYDPEKAKEEAKKLEESKSKGNNPFLNMSDDEFKDLISKNQDTLSKIQNDPELMKEIQANPQKLYDILKEGAEQKTQGPIQSQLLKKYINNSNTLQNNAQSVEPKESPAPESAQAPLSVQPQSANGKEQNPSRYIPSSAPVDLSAQQAQEAEQAQALFARMDATIAKYGRQ